MRYVKVPEVEARAMENIKLISEKGHSADVKYVAKDNKWIIYDVDKKKKEILAS